MRTTLRPAATQSVFVHYPVSRIHPTLSQHSNLLCGIGLRAYGQVCQSNLDFSRRSTKDGPTDCADDAGSAMVLLWKIIDVEIALPFQLCAIREMI